MFTFIVAVSRTCLLIVIVAALSSFAAAQKCTPSVTGDWTLQQDNGITVKLSLRQTDKKVTGSASFQGMKQGHGHMEFGKVDGVFQQEGPHNYPLRVEIRWDYGEIGVYKGWLQTRCGDSGCKGTGNIIKGYAYIRQDALNQDRKSNWRIVQDIPCVPVKKTP
jgi:hypothetical protein